ncbi:hypothetical protein GN956_G4492 [Arapaima gigas]
MVVASPCAADVDPVLCCGKKGLPHLPSAAGSNQGPLRRLKVHRTQPQNHQLESFLEGVDQSAAVFDEYS